MALMGLKVVMVFRKKGEVYVMEQAREWTGLMNPTSLGLAYIRGVVRTS